MVLVFCDMDYIKQENTITQQWVSGYFMMENVWMEGKANLKDCVCFQWDKQRILE